MTSKDLSIFNSLRPFSIGFDDMFDQFESMLDNGGLVQIPGFQREIIIKELMNIKGSNDKKRL